MNPCLLTLTTRSAAFVTVGFEEKAFRSTFRTGSYFKKMKTSLVTGMGNIPSYFGL